MDPLKHTMTAALFAGAMTTATTVHAEPSVVVDTYVPGPVTTLETYKPDPLLMSAPSPSDSGQKTSISGLLNRLPGYVGDCIKAEGLAIPGTQAAIMPRFDGGVLKGPSGANFSIRF